MLSIVKLGGKQYRISQGDIINVEKLSHNIGDKFVVGDVVACILDSGEFIFSANKLSKVKVEAELVDNIKDDKIVIFKKKRRHGYQKKTGHRQKLSRIKILSITASAT